MSDNTLYYGDNLDVMRRYLKDESVDLIYLDPPFNSNAAYNAFFKEKGGKTASAQIKAFEDTWHWVNRDNKSFSEFQAIVDDTRTPGLTRKLLLAFYDFMGGCDMMAYIMMMTPRLVELCRVLKPTGSIYLHCDPTASSYLKLILDGVFGKENYVNEIIWPRLTASKAQTNGFGRTHDVIHFYSKNGTPLFNRPVRPLSEERIHQHYSNVESVTGRRYMLSDFTQSGAGPTRRFGGREIAPPPHKHWIWSQDRIDEAMAEGRLVFTNPNVPRLKRYLDKSKGDLIEDVWSDIHPINAMSKEKLGYPTQKPLALLRRIISASCPPGGVVLDPFCGCGTTVDAAQDMGFRWIGIDITQVAITTIKKRLIDTYEQKQIPVRFLRASDPESATTSPKDSEGGLVVRVIGEPVTPEDAAKMAKEDEYGFQWWAVGLVGGRGTEKQKKGADGGIDGKVLFRDDPKSAGSQEIILQVKGGHLKADDVRALGYVVEREKAAIGVLISLDQPTEKMYGDAAAAGYYTHKLNGQKFPRIQLRTVKELMEGKGIERPSSATSTDDTFKKAAPAKPSTGQSPALPL